MRNREEVAKNYKIDITDPSQAPFLDAVVDTLNLVDNLAEREDWEGLRLLQDVILEVIEDTDKEVDASTTQKLNDIGTFVRTASEKGQPIAPTLANWDKKKTQH